MFASSKHLLRRTPDAIKLRRVGPARSTAHPVAEVSHRHPAMRGLDISPVHGRHCICDRCQPGQRAA